MNHTGHSNNGSGTAADMHQLRLMSLLQELERDHGRKKAAEMLGVDRRTLDAGLYDGVLSRRMRSALDRALQSGVGSAAAEQRERNDQLEARAEELAGAIEELGREMRVQHRAREDAIRGLRAEWAEMQRWLETELAALGLSGGSGYGASEKESSAGSQPERRALLRREFPDLVTLEPAPDDEEVFGAVWPLIVDWRELKATHPNQGKGLSWLRTEERFLALELALLEEHGLTLPPARFPLRGFDRNGQVNWRRTALSDTRRALHKWELLRRLGRVLTLGRCWR